MIWVYLIKINNYLMLCFIYSSLVIFLLLLGYIRGDGDWWLSLINTFRYWLFVPVPLFFLDQFSNYNKHCTFFLSLLSISWFLLYAPPIDFVKKQDSSSYSKIRTGKEIKIISFNSFASNKNIPKILSLVQDQDPDILCMQELSPQKAKSIEKFFKFKSYNSHTEIYDLACFSKFPIEEQDKISSQNGQFLFNKIKTTNNIFYILNIHTFSLDPFDAVDKKEQVQETYRKQLMLGRELLTYIQNNNIQREKIIILGDFNSTEGNELYKTLTKTGFKDSYREKNFILPFNSFTFPNNLKSILDDRDANIIPFLRIDYIFTGKSFQILESQVLKNKTDSDHRPVSVSVRIL